MAWRLPFPDSFYFVFTVDGTEVDGTSFWTATKRNGTFASRIRSTRWQIYIYMRLSSEHVRTPRSWSISRHIEKLYFTGSFYTVFYARAWVRLMDRCWEATSTHASTHAVLFAVASMWGKIKRTVHEQSKEKSPRPNMCTFWICIQLICPAVVSEVFSKRPGAKAKWPQSGLRRKPLLSGKYLVVKKTNSKRIKASTQTKTTLCCDLANWRRWSNNEEKAVSRVRETLSAIPSDLVAVRNT